MEKLPQRLVNVGAARPGRVVDDVRVTEAVDAAQQSLSGAGRVLLRPSGTEPLVRVMVEGQDATQVERIAEEIAAVVRAVAVG